MLSSPGHATNDKAEVCKSGRGRRATTSWRPIARLTTSRRLSPPITSTIRPRRSSCGSSAAAGSTALPPSLRRACGRGIAVLRPLLDIPKARLAATLTEAGITWAEDPSNRDQRFERARMRAASDALGKLGLTPEALARSARRLRRARAALDHAADKFLAEHGAMSEAGYCLIARDALIASPRKSRFGCWRGRSTPSAAARRRSGLRSSNRCLQASAKIRRPRTRSAAAVCSLPADALACSARREGLGLPSLQLAPGERALWDNRFAVELESKRKRAGHRRGPRRGALARSSCLSPLARRTAALRRRDAPCVLRWGSILVPRLGPGSDGG